jgi:hypothetical protein
LCTSARKHLSKNPAINQAPYFVDIREDDRMGWRSGPAGGKIRGGARAACAIPGRARFNETA